MVGSGHQTCCLIHVLCLGIGVVCAESLSTSTNILKHMEPLPCATIFLSCVFHFHSPIIQLCMFGQNILLVKIFFPREVKFIKSVVQESHQVITKQCSSYTAFFCIHVLILSPSEPFRMHWLFCPLSAENLSAFTPRLTYL